MNAHLERCHHQNAIILSTELSLIQELHTYLISEKYSPFSSYKLHSETGCGLDLFFILFRNEHKENSPETRVKIIKVRDCDAIYVLHS